MVEINSKYATIISHPTRYTICTGGRGSGKSFSVNMILLLLMMEETHKVLFLRQTLTSAYISIIPEFQEKIDLLGLSELFEITKNEITYTPNGSMIMFRGIQTGSKSNTANLKSLQGITDLVIDEAEEVVNESEFDKIDLSVRQKGVTNRVILIMNPSTKEHWVYKRFFENESVNPGWTGIQGNVNYIHTTYLDNIKNVDESFIMQINAMKDRNPSKYNHIVMGGWLDRAEGVIFNNWEIGDFKEVKPPVYGADFGFSIDPTTLIKVSIDEDKRVIYTKELLYKPQLTTSEIAGIFKSQAGDSLIYGDSAEPRLIYELQDKGVNIVEAVKGQGSITAGIAVLQDFKLIVDPDSVNLIKELNNYAWHDKKSNTPIDAFNHLLDAMRYAVYSTMENKFQFSI